MKFFENIFIIARVTQDTSQVHFLLFTNFKCTFRSKQTRSNRRLSKQTSHCIA